MTSQIIDSVIYDTEAATLVLKVPGLAYSRQCRFDKPSNIFFPGEIERADSEMYVGANGEWFIVQYLVKRRQGLFKRREHVAGIEAITPDVALQLLHQANAIDAAKQWFPSEARNA